MRPRARTRTVAVALCLALAGLGSTASAKGKPTPQPSPAGPSTLVLYDTTNTYGWLGELYAMYAGNLASHFGSWSAKPVTSYTAGMLSGYAAVVYVGSTYDEPLPAAFLDDVYATTKPVVWIYDNIWQQTARHAGFQTKYGWTWKAFDFSTVATVRYKGTDLSRYAANGSGIMDYAGLDPSKATVIARAVRADGTTFPWAVRSGNLTYIGEIPFAYTGETDRVIAFEDMLFDALAPATPTRHRALIRLEDINPDASGDELRAAVDALYSRGIPFGFGVSPVFRDPLNYYGGGTQKTFRDNPALVDAINYALSHGGVMVEHGYTHQYSTVINPYTGASGDDFEFYRVTENPDHTLNYIGPVAEDSASWASSRVSSSAKAFQQAHLPVPTIYEFPHYAASATDYRVVASKFPTRWERALYFGGVLGGGAVDHSHMIGQTFPYVVHDVYGDKVLPENVGNYSPEPFFIFPPHTVQDILNAATKNLLVRDGIAGAYYHQFEGPQKLGEIVDGMRALGYTFVSPASL